MKLIILYLSILALPLASYGQYCGDNGPGKIVVLHDFSTGHDFVLDCTHTLLSAYDKNGILIWATDPWIDNSFKEYKTKRPFIVHLSFSVVNSNELGYKRFQSWNANSINDYYPNQLNTTVMALSIAYNNGHFGLINLENGKYLSQGND